MQNPIHIRREDLSGKDCLSLLPFVLHISKTYAPFWTIAAFVFPILRLMVPVHGAYGVLPLMIDALNVFFFSMIGYLIITTLRHTYDAQSPAPSCPDLKTAGRLWMLAYTVEITILVAYCLLVIPGLILNLRTCLALPIFCIERRGVISSFNESIRLTKGHAWTIIKYFLPPILLTGLCAGFAFLLLHLSGTSAVRDWTLGHHLTMLKYPLFAAATAMSATVSVLLHFSTIGMKFKLYNYLKDKEEDQPMINNAIEPNTRQEQ